MKTATQAEIRRFWEHVYQGHPSACWKSTFPQSNVPMMRHAGDHVSARRWFWERSIGALQKGDRITVFCKTSWCMNPGHFEKIEGEAGKRSKSLKMSFPRDPAKKATSERLGEKLRGIFRNAS